MDERIKIGSTVELDALSEDFPGIRTVVSMLGGRSASTRVSIQALTPLGVSDESGRQLFLMPEAACGHGGSIVQLATQNLQTLRSQSVQMGQSTCSAHLHARRGPGPCAALVRARSDAGSEWLILFVHE